jgi:GxxExxY protein
MRDEVTQNEIAHVVIGCSMTVHRRVGPGCFESTYAPCLAHELAREGLRFDVDVAMDLVYEDGSCLAPGLLLNFGAATMAQA